MDWYTTLVVVVALGFVFVLYFIPKELPFDSNAEAFTLKMVKLHYYDALGCKIDGGYTFTVKGSDKDFEKQVKDYIDKRFKPNTKIYWEILSVEGE